MTRKTLKQTGAHQKQLDILTPTCAVYELRYLYLQHEMQVPLGGRQYEICTDLRDSYVMQSSEYYNMLMKLEKIIGKLKIEKYGSRIDEEIASYESDLQQDAKERKEQKPKLLRSRKQRELL
ncbi:hypothetical protein BC332_25926 [Capsicum chinense]|nr:hypothetical protein BC332_25926 [Capsicum chinense]